MDLLADLFWTMFVVFFFVVYFMALFSIFGDLFRADMSGWSKAGWVLFIFAIPLIAMLIYLIVHGRNMGERAAAESAKQQQMMESYVRDAAGSSSSADEIAKAKNLLDTGAISQEEFDALKAKALA